MFVKTFLLSLVLCVTAYATPLQRCTSAPANPEYSTNTEWASGECYRLTTYDYRHLKLTPSGDVVVDGVYAANRTTYDLLLRPLDTLSNSISRSVENNAFIWQVVSPQLTSITGSSVNYLSAGCGERLHLEPMATGQCVPLDGHFTRVNISEPANFRYIAYDTNCYLEIQVGGTVAARSQTSPSTTLHRLPVDNTLVDFTLQVTTCDNSDFLDSNSSYFEMTTETNNATSQFPAEQTTSLPIDDENEIEEDPTTGWEAIDTTLLPFKTETAVFEMNETTESYDTETVYF